MVQPPVQTEAIAGGHKGPTGRVRLLARWPCGPILALVLLAGDAAFAQVPARPSFAGSAAAAGRRRGDEVDYNLRLGPIRLKLNAGLQFEYDDNVNLADERISGEFGPQSDFFIRPQLNMIASWQVTQINRLSLRLGMGYEFSLNDSRDTDVSPFTLAPDSELGFDIFIGDVRINLHDRFSLQNNPVSQATSVNTGGYSLFTNAAGISVLWDLNDVVVTGGYDYIIERYTGGSAEANDRDSHQLQLSVAFLLNETTTTGIQGSALLSTRTGITQEEQSLYSLGPFLEFQLTPYTRFVISGGAQLSETEQNAGTVGQQRFVIGSDGEIFEIGSGGGEATEDSGGDLGFYWTVAAYNRLNVWYNHSLTAGHERQVGLGANYVDIDYIRYSASWRVNSNITLDLTTGFEHYEESQGLNPETLNRWQAGIGFSYRLRGNLSTTFRYNFNTKSSDLALRDYQQNVVTVGLVYDF